MTCQNCKQPFQILLEDTAFYAKMSVPPPTWCPECRAIRRFQYWNEHNLYLKRDARTGKELFSTFPEESAIQIYDHDFWWGDGWDPMSFGQDYDFSRPFFEQFRDLSFSVPRPSREIKGNINSDYTNNTSYMKNCYLCFDADDNENCLYGVGFRHSRDTMDVYSCNKLEQCYDLFSCDEGYRVFFSHEADGNRESAFLRDCLDCMNCFGCVGLRHKQHYIFNKPYTKESYEAKIREFDLGSHVGLQKIKSEAHAFWLMYPYRFSQTFKSENVIGDYIYNSRNVYHCFEAFGVEGVRYCQNVINGVKDSMDYTSWGDACEQIYESTICGSKCYNLKFCISAWPSCSDLTYCYECHSSSNLFGCVGLRNKNYCILNKQYPKEEYLALVQKIILQMNQMPYTDRVGRTYRYGEFFPPEHSPFAYNETVAQSYRPSDKASVEANGFSWRDPHPKAYETTIAAADLPDHIRDAPDSITKEMIQCASCRRAYRIAPMELRFLREWGIALPRLCYNCRYAERMVQRNTFRWYHRTCMCNIGSQGSEVRYQNTVAHFHGKDRCSTEFETTFAPDRPHMVYCEQCYQAEFLS